MDMEKIDAESALKRCNSAPKIVVVAPTGSGKSTLTFLLMNEKLIPHMRRGIGDKSLTTIIPSEFCLDERVKDDKFAIKISLFEDFRYENIHRQIVGILLKLFADHDYEVNDTIDAIDERVVDNILEPVEGIYHLERIKDHKEFEETIEFLKTALKEVLEALNDNHFEEMYKEKKAQMKSRKPRVEEIREIVFDEIFGYREGRIKEIKENYINCLKRIGKIVKDMLSKAVGDDVFKGEIIEFNIEEDPGKAILRELFDPSSPYSLLVECINVACSPRKELVQIAKCKESKYSNLPFRFCFRDTMGMNQGFKDLDLNDIGNSLEVALNCKADAVLYLMSLEENNIILEACSNALAKKLDKLKEENHLKFRFNILYTKADRIVENKISKKREDGGLFINQAMYNYYIDAALNEVDEIIKKLSKGLSSDSVGYGSMRFVENSLIETALEGDERLENFKPEGIFIKISDMVWNTLFEMLPKDVNNPVFVSAKEPDEPAVSVSIKNSSIQENITKIKSFLCDNKEIVNGYIISATTPRIHGRSVKKYWDRLGQGLGYSTRAYVYGNFTINMKGLMKRAINSEFPKFDSFDIKKAINLTADNLNDDELKRAMEELFGNGNLETGMNPALENRSTYLSRLYEFFKNFFQDDYRYASVVDRVSFNLTYGDPDVRSLLNDAYSTWVDYGYDYAIRKLQNEFKAFFASDKFAELLINQFALVMNEMINKLFITI